MDTMQALYKAVKAHSGMERDEIRDVCGVSAGADAGHSGFTYTVDCVRFFDENETLIMDRAQVLAEDLGHANVYELANTFGRRELLKMGQDGFKNLMAWFILEEVSYWLQDQDEKDGD